MIDVCRSASTRGLKVWWSFALSHGAGWNSRFVLVFRIVCGSNCQVSDSNCLKQKKRDVVAGKMFSERRNLEKYLGDTTAFRELGSYIESYKTVRVGFSARLRHIHLHQQKILICIESIELCYPSVFLESGSAHLGVPILCLMRQITLWTPVIALTNSHQLWDI